MRSRAADIDVIYLTGYGFPALSRRSDVLRRHGRPAAGPRTGRGISSRTTASDGRRRRCSSGWRARDRTFREYDRRARVRPVRVLDNDADVRRAPAVSSTCLAVRRSAPIRSASPTSSTNGRTGAGRIFARAIVSRAKITERLEDWADRAPARTFLAERDPAGRMAHRHVPRGARRACGRIAQALLDRGLSADRPIVILSGNSIEHALLALGGDVRRRALCADRAGLLAAGARLRQRCGTSSEGSSPALVFADEGAAFERALDAVLPAGHGTRRGRPSGRDGRWTPSTSSEQHARDGAVDDAHARVGPDTIAKVLFTSGSTGHPKGVINTQRMLCSNQEMIRAVMQFLADEPPVLCDWLPWNHTAGGNHNFGIALYNGGTIYIDDGKPTPALFDRTLRNLREVACTTHFTVPRFYEMLLPHLRSRRGAARAFFRG